MKKKIIAALGLLVVINTPSADAMIPQLSGKKERDTFLRLSRDSHYKPAPNVVDLPYELPNGFIGMLRDVTIKLLLIAREEDYLRKVFGMNQDIYLYKKHSYFQKEYAVPRSDEVFRRHLHALVYRHTSPEGAKLCARHKMKDFVDYLIRSSGPLTVTTIPCTGRYELGHFILDNLAGLITLGSRSDKESLSLLHFLTPYMDDDLLLDIANGLDPHTYQPVAYAVFELLIRRNAPGLNQRLRFLIRNALFLRNDFSGPSQPEMLLKQIVELDRQNFLHNYREFEEEEKRRSSPRPGLRPTTILDTRLSGLPYTYIGFDSLTGETALLAAPMDEEITFLESLGAKEGVAYLADARKRETEVHK